MEWASEVGVLVSKPAEAEPCLEAEADGVADGEATSDVLEEEGTEENSSCLLAEAEAETDWLGVTVAE